MKYESPRYFPKFHMKDFSKSAKVTLQSEWLEPGLDILALVSQHPMLQLSNIGPACRIYKRDI